MKNRSAISLSLPVIIFILAVTGCKKSQGTAAQASKPDIYVAGYESNGTKGVAKQWKNGVVQSLTDGSQNALTTSVYVSGADVYVAGHEANGTYYVAKIWKNGVAEPLTNGSQHGYADGVFLK